MKLLNLKACRYRSLYDQTIPLKELNLFIGTNASGKSTILDALRFLQEGVRDRDFARAVFARGGIVHLGWKGEEVHKIDLQAVIEHENSKYEWSIQLERTGYDFAVHRESVMERRPGSPPVHLLQADSGRGWWWSGEKNEPVALAQPPTACALGNAAPNIAFPARGVAEFVGRWGFFDPSPFLLRRGWPGMDPLKLDPYGRNLADRLSAIQETSPEAFAQILSATQSVLGLPSEIELRKSRTSDERYEDAEDRVYFVQREPGLKFKVHQIGASSGTLRMLALMTALFGETETNLIGIEEPENHIHPTALEAFALYLLKARERVQVLVTTHSPLLLDFINDPAVVNVVRHTEDGGTRVSCEENAERIRTALQESGFGLGEFYATKGFGG